MREISAGDTRHGRIRRADAGRKKITVCDPKLLASWEELIEPETCGDPESPLVVDMQEHSHPGRAVDEEETSGQSREGSAVTAGSELQPTKQS